MMFSPRDNQNCVQSTEESLVADLAAAAPADKLARVVVGALSDAFFSLAPNCLQSTGSGTEGG